MSFTKTRIIRRESSLSRDGSTNPATLVVRRYERAPPPRPSVFRSLFVRNYAVIRDTCTRHHHAGVAVIAIDGHSGCVHSSLWLASKPGVPNAAIIGRHARADLWLEGDPSLSLRHLALLLWPDRGDGEVCVRILDLRTQLAFHDEHGRQYESLVSEGPLFVRCGRHALFLIVTGDEVSWPENASDGWECIPERVYLDSDDAEPDRWQRKRAWAQSVPADITEGGTSSVESTLVHRVRGPIWLGTTLLAADEQPLGRLTVVMAMRSRNWWSAPGRRTPAYSWVVMRAATAS